MCRMPRTRVRAPFWHIAHVELRGELALSYWFCDTSHAVLHFETRVPDWNTVKNDLSPVNSAAYDLVIGRITRLGAEAA